MNAMVETFLTDEIGSLPFCPGCGHDRLVKALDRALVQLQPDPKKVVIVTDIGCIGLADRYFVTHAFHGLHGRSITYACGLKLARPELTVVVLKGDGGCGIGGAHLLNVARRNIGITLIVANNFNYGMTGGQHSVTTPLDGITATTPLGNLEGAMDLGGVATAAGASWAYRGTGFDADLAERIAEAIRQPGFSMLDIWDMCTAYYLPRNQLGKKDLSAMMERLGLKAGLLADRPRPEHGEQ
jgi:pyruvate/2-oxoacid:ferredoxin oxidoreductase beta subunit